MILSSALEACGVPAVLLAVGVGLAALPAARVDPEAIETAAARPLALPRGGSYGFRFSAPDAYPLEYRPWIRSRADLIAYFTRGEDPALVRRYCEGPEEELIAYLGEVFNRPGTP
jgi:hypothetical protein